jgi:hypothetical protein
MNPKQFVRISNIIGILSIVFLTYWIFTFVTIEFFGLKIFRQNLTEIFYLSVTGILALLVCALIVNIMFNLTRIAQKHNQDEPAKPIRKKVVWVFLAIFPMLLLVLFGGDYLTSKKKEGLLLKSAESIFTTNSKKSDHFLNYTFDENWIIETEEILEIISKKDNNFRHISILMKDSISNEPIFLGFTAQYHKNPNDTIQPIKKKYTIHTTQPEREYLNSVFDNSNGTYRFSSYDGRHELFYPYFKGQKKIVLYLSDYQRNGKIGS